MDEADLEESPNWDDWARALMSWSCDSGESHDEVEAIHQIFLIELNDEADFIIEEFLGMMESRSDMEMQNIKGVVALSRIGKKVRFDFPDRGVHLQQHQHMSLIEMPMGPSGLFNQDVLMVKKESQPVKESGRVFRLSELQTSGGFESPVNVVAPDVCLDWMDCMMTDLQPKVEGNNNNSLTFDSNPCASIESSELPSGSYSDGWHSEFGVHCENALIIYGRQEAAHSSDEIVTGLTEIAGLFESMGENKQVLSLFQKALKIMENTPGQKSVVGDIEEVEVLCKESVFMEEVKFRFVKKIVLSVIQCDVLWRRLIRCVHEQYLAKLKMSSLVAM